MGEVALILAYANLEKQFRDDMVEFEDGGESTNVMIAGGVMAGVGVALETCKAREVSRLEGR